MMLRWDNLDTVAIVALSLSLSLTLYCWLRWCVLLHLCPRCTRWTRPDEFAARTYQTTEASGLLGPQAAQTALLEKRVVYV